MGVQALEQSAGSVPLTPSIHRRIALALLILAVAPAAWPQAVPVSRSAADAALIRWPATVAQLPKGNRWEGEFAILLAALEEEWLGTADARYFRYIQSSIDARITPEGAILGYTDKSSILDHVAFGRELLLLYRVTQQDKYLQAATFLRAQLGASAGALQGEASRQQAVPQAVPEKLLMEEPYFTATFEAKFAAISRRPEAFADITRQFETYERNSLDPRTGLLDLQQHDARKRPSTPQIAGSSETVELAITARYMMALVDTLPYYPRSDPGRAKLLQLLLGTARAIARHPISAADALTQAPGASAAGDSDERVSSLNTIAYSIAKAVRLGLLPPAFLQQAEAAYREAKGRDIAAVGDNPEAMGMFILASREMEIAPQAKLGLGKKVLMDAWFNSQTRPSAFAGTEYFHYKWDNFSDSGFSIFGHLLNDHGLELDTLYEAPTVTNLSSTQFYFIVSPDIPAKNSNPHYVTKQDADQVANWVERGGVLVLMENDPANADIEHLDLLSDKFGIHFNNVLSHHVVGDEFPMGRIQTANATELFPIPRVLYMKDTCTIAVSGAARPLLIDKGDVMMAAAKYGKGTVFAVVDPWLYNEYTDGRKLPPEYENLAGAQELVEWLARQAAASSGR